MKSSFRILQFGEIAALYIINLFAKQNTPTNYTNRPFNGSLLCSSCSMFNKQCARDLLLSYVFTTMRNMATQVYYINFNIFKKYNKIYSIKKVTSISINEKYFSNRIHDIDGKDCVSD